jgi:hypothetical protein
MCVCVCVCGGAGLGTGKGASVLDMVKAFSQASGREIKYEIKPRRPGDIASCYAGVFWPGPRVPNQQGVSVCPLCAGVGGLADPSKAERELHWVATRSIEQVRAFSLPGPFRCDFCCGGLSAHVSLGRHAKTPGDGRAATPTASPERARQQTIEIETGRSGEGGKKCCAERMEIKPAVSCG